MKERDHIDDMYLSIAAGIFGGGVFVGFLVGSLYVYWRYVP